MRRGFGIMCGMKIGWEGAKSQMKKIVRVFLYCLAFVVMSIIAVVGTFVGICKYQTRTFDRVYSSKSDLPNGHRTRAVKRFLPDSATNIQLYGTAKFGEFENHFSCRIGESEFIEFAARNNYEIITNGFTKLDYGSFEQESSSFIEWRNEQIESDAKRQFQLVLGEAFPPKRFFSHTESHAFDGGAVGGCWRWIVIFDRDACKLSGYVFESCL